MTNFIRNTTAIGVTLTFAFIGLAHAQDSNMKMEDMMGQSMSEMSCCDTMAPGFGVINSVDLKSNSVNITHDPIKKIGWGEMTMNFDVGTMVALDKFETGDNVHFMLKKDEGGAFDISMMMPIGGDPDAFKKTMMSMMKGGDMMSCGGMEMNSMSGMKDDK